MPIRVNNYYDSLAEPEDPSGGGSLRSQGKKKRKAQQKKKKRRAQKEPIDGLKEGSIRNGDLDNDDDSVYYSAQSFTGSTTESYHSAPESVISQGSQDLNCDDGRAELANTSLLKLESQPKGPEPVLGKSQARQELGVLLMNAEAEVFKPRRDYEANIPQVVVRDTELDGEAGDVEPMQQLVSIGGGQQDGRPNFLTNMLPPLSARRLNVESPSFTPGSLQTSSPSNGGSASSPGSKKSTFSSNVASAASFIPRSNNAPTGGKDNDASASALNPAKFQEFTPQTYDLQPNINPNGAATEAPLGGFDAFTMANLGQALPATPFNLYAEDAAALGNGGSMFQQQNAFNAAQPLQYHLYAPLGIPREGLLPYQRQTHDFFLPESIREDAQRKFEATYQVLNTSGLPSLDNYISLVPLDTSNRESVTSFKHVSWVYKAFSQESGKFFCLRRIKDFRLTNEHAIRSVNEWKKVLNGGVVSVHGAFTTRKFGDSSIIFVYDYHPRSQTLAQHHFSQPANRYNNRPAIPEDVLWSYTTQLANALRIIHKLNLAARCLEPSKIILSEKNRIRLSACSILDVLEYETQRPLHDLQQNDLVQFGQVMLSLASNTPPGSVNYNNVNMVLQQVSNMYSEGLANSIAWLLFPSSPNETKTIDVFISKISGQIMSNMDSLYHQNDTLNSQLYREIENGRLFRLMAKLGCINERQEHDGDRQWSENGERYSLKLFRDYVFHQVDANGAPALDLSHIITCLNKLDAGSDETICLTSRDEQSVFVVSYKELKKQVGSAFGDLLKGSQSKGRGF